MFPCVGEARVASDQPGTDARVAVDGGPELLARTEAQGLVLDAHGHRVAGGRSRLEGARVGVDDVQALSVDDVAELPLNVVDRRLRASESR